MWHRNSFSSELDHHWKSLITIFVYCIEIVKTLLLQCNIKKKIRRELLLPNIHTNFFIATWYYAFITITR